MFRRPLKIVLSCVGCVLFSLGSFAARNRPDVLPPLLQDIIGDRLLKTDGPGEFERRLNKRFPVGSAATVLLQELSKEGFKFSTSPDAAIRTATYQRMGRISDLARRDASVSWAVNKEGRLTSVTGHYFVQIS